MTSSPVELLVLHAVRITGFADTPVVARRFDLDPVQTAEILDDARAYGWVQRASFADLHGWSLTESGRAEDERLLAAELSRVGGAGEVRTVYEAFGPLNARVLKACTHWQLRPAPDGRLVGNDHGDPAWDAAVLDELAAVDGAFAPWAGRLGNLLTRFHGYDLRFAAALARARAGDGRWIDGTDVDSCHRVWFELHEDIVATLGIDRRTERQV